MLSRKRQYAIILKLVSAVVLAALLLFYLIAVFGSGPSKEAILKKVSRLTIDYQLNQTMMSEAEQREYALPLGYQLDRGELGEAEELALVLEAESWLNEALGRFKDDANLLGRRFSVRLLLRHYEDALADLAYLESIADPPLQGRNNMKCMLMERLERPAGEYLACYKKAAEALQMAPEDFYSQNKVLSEYVLFEIAMAYALAKDFTALEAAMNELKNYMAVNPQLVMEFADYAEIINGLRTDSGRKDMVYNVFP